jgi:hypothetical protein
MTDETLHGVAIRQTRRASFSETRSFAGFGETAATPSFDAIPFGDPVLLFNADEIVELVERHELGFGA